MRIPNAYTFNGEEINIIMAALIYMARSMEDENGEPKPEKKRDHDRIISLYRTF